MLKFESVLVNGDSRAHGDRMCESYFHRLGYSFTHNGSGLTGTSYQCQGELISKHVEDTSRDVPCYTVGERHAHFR